MQIPYTGKAKRALDIAARMSRAMHHNYIGTEHILLGLLKENTGVAAQVLKENGVELDKVLKLIEELIAPGQSAAILEPEGYSPRVERVLAGANKEAERFRSELIGMEHILLAIVKEPECVRRDC